MLIMCLLLVAAMVSCGDAKDTPDETEPQTPVDTNKGIRTEAPKTQASVEAPNPLDYDYFHVFKAPEGNPRDIVYNYMYAMSQIKWVATESWTTDWKVPQDYTVNLPYVKGKTYYGLPYSLARSSLDEFSQYVENESFTPNSHYYEEIIGNNCSSAMDLAYNQILNFPGYCQLRPSTNRTDLLKFPDGIEVPPARSSNPDDWISQTVFSHNGLDAMYNGYAQLGKGDILYRMIDGSGHTRMVSKVEVTRSVAGKLVPAKSYIYCIEQTNTWADNKRNSTWFVDRKYTFSECAELLFMPVTFHIFHEDNPVLEDAYIMMKGKNSPESVKKLLNGVVESTFPLTYVRATVTDSEGKIVGDTYKNNMHSTYKVSVRNFDSQLKISKLPAGTYTFDLRAGIARGGVTLESFQFTIS